MLGEAAVHHPSQYGKEDHLSCVLYEPCYADAAPLDPRGVMAATTKASSHRCSARIGRYSWVRVRWSRLSAGFSGKDR